MIFGFRFSWGTKPLPQPWQSIALLLVGLGFATGAVYNYFETSKFVQSSIQVTGVVTNLDQRGDLYYPVIRYRDSNFEKHFIHSSTGSSTPFYELGESVKIYYSKADPGDARIDSLWDLWFLVWFLALFGVAFTSVSILLWIFLK